MQCFNCVKKIPIPIDCEPIYKYMCFDGCYYYFLPPCKSKIIKYDLCLNKVCCIEVKRIYSTICYDYECECFWATSSGCYGRIFKLDACLNEIDCICVKNTYCNGDITGISYNCCNNTIIISYPKSIYEVDKCTGDNECIYTVHCGWITNVTSICPGTLFTVLDDEKQYVYVLGEDNVFIKKIEIPCRCIINSIIFNPCNKKCADKLNIYVTKCCCYPFIVECCVFFDELGFEPAPCNYCICRDCKDPCCDGCCDIIESIALVEAAISHILNAEGEKLQKVIAETDDIDKIMCVNKEINKTIVNVTHLEQVLYSKLATAVECCDDCDSCDCCDDHHDDHDKHDEE